MLVNHKVLSLAWIGQYLTQGSPAVIAMCVRPVALRPHLSISLPLQERNVIWLLYKIPEACKFMLSIFGVFSTTTTQKTCFCRKK